MMYGTAETMEGEYRLRLLMQLALGEYLAEQGFELAGSNSWQLMVWTGEFQRSVVVSIIAGVHDGKYSFVPMEGAGMGSCRIPWEEPFEVIVGLLRELRAKNPHEIAWGSYGQFAELSARSPMLG